MHLISCHHVHHVCIHVRHPSIFPVVRFAFRRFVLLRWSFLAFFRVWGIKHFRIGPRLAKRPWFTNGRPPVKFHAIWTLFDTPTVNRGTVKASCVLQPNTPPNLAQKPTKLCSIVSVVRSRSCGRKPHLIWTLLAPSMPIYTPSIRISSSPVRNPS